MVGYFLLSINREGGVQICMFFFTPLHMRGSYRNAFFRQGFWSTGVLLCLPSQSFLPITSSPPFPQTGRDPAVIVWDFKTGKSVAELRRHKYGISRVIFSPNERCATFSFVFFWVEESALEWCIWGHPYPPQFCVYVTCTMSSLCIYV